MSTNIALFGQQSILASGGRAVENSFSLSYSVGQVFCGEVNANDGTVLHGIQHPLDVSIVTDNAETNMSLLCFVYPNPSTTYLILKIQISYCNHFSFVFSDINGRVLLSKTITEVESIVNLTDYHSGTYVLKVVSNNRKDCRNKIFKIIKK